MGGINDDTEYRTLDMADEGNIIAGGWTNDDNVTGISSVSAIIIYIKKGNLYKWGTMMDHDKVQMVTNLKFNPSAEKLAATF